MQEKTELAIQRLADRYAPGWVDIDKDKPIDRRVVLLYYPQLGKMFAGYRLGDEYFVDWSTPQMISAPRYWTPLPVTPLVGMV